MDEVKSLTEALEVVEGALRRGVDISLIGVTEGVQGLFFAELLKRGHDLLIVVPREEAAEDLLVDILFFHPEGRLKAFDPDRFELDLFDGVSRLLYVLSPLAGGGLQAVVTTPEGLALRVPSPEALRSAQRRLQVGQVLDREGLIEDLIASGYERVRTVEARGEMSVRGAILDLFPPDRDMPIRIEFFDEEVESIRAFDPLSQRSREGLQEVLISPAKLQGEVTLLDYLPSAPVALVEAEEVEERLGELHRGLRDEHRPLFRSPAEVMGALAARPRVLLDGTLKGEAKAEVKVEAFLHHGLREEVKAKGFKALVSRFKDWLGKGWEVELVASNRHQAQRLVELLEDYGVKATLGHGERGRHVMVREGDLSRGFLLPREGLVFLTEEEIFGQKARAGPTPKQPPAFYNFEDLKPGDFVVHVDYGIGLYKGLVKLEVEGSRNEFLLIEYADGDRLYVPIERLNLVHRYVGPGDSPPRLDRLGGTAWRKAKRRARRAVQEVAKELVELYAARKALPGFSFSPPDAIFREFEATFPYEETPDQWEAIEEVLEDMSSPTPMDRLLCGDVGFGKTEVAVRATFKAVMDGKQVAVLVPTTVLAEQHYRTFSERFRGYPIVVEVLSRFRPPAEQRRIVQGLKEGKVDVVIGTHRLLQRDVAFRDLGLLIIDEEQRFGVAHKERLKELKKTVDCLTLTATPIPRTLQMSLVGLREMSLIITPPPNRQAIKTRVIQFGPHLIREAILREVGRGGQVFFVHNRVADIDRVAQKLRGIVPEVRIEMAHGQMRGRQLEEVMMRFVRGEIDVLVCTSIIESGLDIPNANTIVINRADAFGLADLYQLRGRVGRSARRAYAYLIVPPRGELTRDALKRLRALQELTELGSGFRLALRDLEIRGAGTLLGHRQSGHIADVGLELYNAMLEEAIREIKGEEVSERITPEIKVPVEAYIPDDYIEDESQRLLFYKRLSMLEDEAALEEIRGELRDRYGPLPPQVEELLEVIRLKVRLQRYWVRRFEVREGEVRLKMAPGVIDPQRLVQILSKEGERLRLTPTMELILRHDGLHWRQAAEEAEALLQGATAGEIMAREERSGT